MNETQQRPLSSKKLLVAPLGYILSPVLNAFILDPMLPEKLAKGATSILMLFFSALMVYDYYKIAVCKEAKTTHRLSSIPLIIIAVTLLLYVVFASLSYFFPDQMVDFAMGFINLENTTTPETSQQ